MALRSGSYNAAPPVWRGTLREGSYPAYTCTHTDHPDQPAATECASKALAELRGKGSLPPGWVMWGDHRKVVQL